MQLGRVTRVHPQQGSHVSGKQVLQIILLILNSSVPGGDLIVSIALIPCAVISKPLCITEPTTMPLCLNDRSTSKWKLIVAHGEVHNFILHHSLGVRPSERTSTNNRDRRCSYGAGEKGISTEL